MSDIDLEQLNIHKIVFDLLTFANNCICIIYFLLLRHSECDLIFSYYLNLSQCANLLFSSLNDNRA